MNVLVGVILGVATMWIAATAMSLVNGGQLIEKTDTDEFGNIRWKLNGPNRAIGDDWPLAVAGGVVVAATYFLSRAVVFTPVSGLAILFMVFAMGWMAIVTVHGVWVAKKVSHVLCIAGTVAMFFVAAESAALAVVDSFRVRLVGAIPIVAMIVAIVALVGCYCYNRITHQSEALWKKKLTLGSGATVGFVGALLAVLVLAGAVGCSQQTQSPGTSSGETSPAASSQNVAVSAEDINAAKTTFTVSAEEINRLIPEKFKNFSDDPSDNSLAARDKERVAAAGFSDALTFPLSGNTDEERLSDVEKEIFTNSVYGVTVARAMRGKRIGDQTIGDLNPWLETMIANDDAYGVAYWREYRDASKSSMRMTDEYRQNAAGICVLLERMENRGIQTRTTVENWCLNCASLNNDRKGVLASYQYTKDALVLVYTAKSGAVLFEMGFNVHDKRPEFFEDSNGSSSSPDNPTPPGPTPGPNPPGPEPTPESMKDPSQLMDRQDYTNPGDNTGPGEKTIDPKDPNHSTKDRPDNSTSYDNISDYREDMDYLADVNEDQRVEGDPNSPTTETPSGDTVDNSGKAGTGNGGADTATPINQPAETAVGDKTTNNENNAATRWGDGEDPQ